MKASQAVENEGLWIFNSVNSSLENEKCRRSEMSRATGCIDSVLILQELARFPASHGFVGPLLWAPRGQLNIKSLFDGCNVAGGSPATEKAAVPHFLVPEPGSIVIYPHLYSDNLSPSSCSR